MGRTGSGLAPRRERRSRASERAPSPSGCSRPEACAGVFRARRALAKPQSSTPAAALRAAIAIPSVLRSAKAPKSRRLRLRRNGSIAATARRPRSRPGSRLCPALGSSGCLRRRCSSKARGLSGGSTSRRRVRLSSLLRKRWCSGASRWARPGSTRVSETHGASAATASSCSLTRQGSTTPARTLDRKAVGAGARALSTIVASSPNIEARLPDLRAALEGAGSGVESGASAFDGLIVARLLAASFDQLRMGLVASIVALGGRKPRLWP